MSDGGKSQAEKALAVYIRMRQLNIRQYQLKKPMRRSHVSISLALNGRGHKTLLERINRYLDGVERRRQNKVGRSNASPSREE